MSLTSTSANIKSGGSSSPSIVTPAVPTYRSTNATRFKPEHCTEVQPAHYDQDRAPISPVLAGLSNTSITALPSPQTALSAAYRGDPRLVENYSAAIPPDQSTSLFIKNLPADTTITKILAHIRATGKVFSLYLNLPTPPHQGCAAKICFFTREAAAKFYHNTRSGFLIDGHRATVVWNRVLVAEHVGERWDEASRVVIVRGPKGVVTTKSVADIVHREIRLYDLVMVCETDYSELVDGFVEVEVHFGSFRAQAQSAHIVLNRALRRKRVRISYGVDSCA
jgi:hypothetical protein